MQSELIDAIDRADADDAVRAIIVTGAGRGFCAGADLSRGPGTFDRSAGGRAGSEELRDGGGLLTLRLYECQKRLIAAINGPAVGVGITMTLAMDIRLASETARIGFVFARRGLVPEACSSEPVHPHRGRYEEPRITPRSAGHHHSEDLVQLRPDCLRFKQVRTPQAREGFAVRKGSSR